MRRAKIVATIGPATESPERLRELIASGVDVVRINMSHGDRQHHVEIMTRAREAAAELGRPLATLVDLGGPKIRTGRLAGGGPVELADGATIRIVSDQIEGTADVVSTTYPRLPDEVHPGGRILIDDGLIELRVESTEPGAVVARVVNGGPLHERKGLNLPGANLTVPSLTEKDHEDLATALDAGADYIALSFVRTADDVRNAVGLIQKRRSDAQLIAKIEKPEAMENLDAIIEASDGVMVARGDLGVEASPESVPVYQKRIIASAIAAEKVVITATQMLQSMVDSPIPTRAEVLDVANAVLDGSDAVMLSQETAAGKHPDKAVAAMARICLGAERQFEPSEDYASLRPKLERTDQAIALAGMFLASQIGVRAIVALTESGATTQWLSRYRSSVPIYGLSRHKFARQRMTVLRDVYPIDFDPHGGNPLLAAKEAVQLLHRLGKLAEGERVLLTTGDHTGELGGTNTLKLLKVGPGGIAEGLGSL